MNKFDNVILSDQVVRDVYMSCKEHGVNLIQGILVPNWNLSEDTVECDICHIEDRVSTDAICDCRVLSGQWGCLCLKHAVRERARLGLGRGQLIWHMVERYMSVRQPDDGGTEPAIHAVAFTSMETGGSQKCD